MQPPSLTTGCESDEINKRQVFFSSFHFTSPIYRTSSYNPYNYGVQVTVPGPANANSGIKGPAQQREVHQPVPYAIHLYYS